MSEKCVIWVGTYSSTYQDEIDAWLNEGDRNNTVIFPARDAPLDREAPLYENNGHLFSEQKTVLLEDAHEVASADLQKVMKYLLSADDVRVGLLFRGGTPSKNVAALGDVRERLVPYDPEEQATWIQRWLKRRSVLISEEEALKVSSYLLYDVERLVISVIQVANLHAGTRITSQDILRLVDGPGEGDVYDIVSSIVAGDIPGTVLNVQRAYNGIARSDPSYLILNSLMRKFRPIVALAGNPTVDLENFGVYGGAQYYIKREAENISKRSANSIMNYLADLDVALKGGSMGISHRDLVTMAGIRMASECAGQRLEQFEDLLV